MDTDGPILLRLKEGIAYILLSLTLLLKFLLIMLFKHNSIIGLLWLTMDYYLAHRKITSPIEVLNKLIKI